MLGDHENELFESTKRDVADKISVMIERGTHPALIYAAIIAVVLEAVTTEGFWDDDPPGFEDIRGFGNLMWRLQEKAFAGIAAGSSARSRSSTV